MSVAFVAGLTFCLVIIGTLASIIGRLLTQWKVEFAFATAVLSAVAGAAVLMGPAIRMRVPDIKVRKRRGVAGAFIYGFFYSVATLTTSAGPLLLLITIAAAMGRPWYGALLSLAYAIGRGIPFLMLGTVASASGRMLGRVEKYRRPVEIVSGIALLALSVYFVRFALALR